jgi:hypothetical protein
MAITKEQFANAKIDESFGISDDVLVKYVQTSVSGSRWWRYWKDDAAKIKQTFDIARQNGMSAALLVVKEKVEGVGFTNGDMDGWGNHFDHPNADPMVDLANYAQATVTVANSTAYNPSWVDMGNPVNCVPNGVIAEGNADFASTPTGTIKRAYVPMTAATTWAYYYPQALNASVNGVQTYGNPIQQCTDYLNEMGAKITGSGGAGDGGTAPEGGGNDVKPGEPNQNKPLEGSGTSSFDPTSIIEAIQKAIKQILDLLTQNYSQEKLSIYGSKTGLMFTQVNKNYVFAYDFFNDNVKSISDTLSDVVGDELQNSGAIQDELPNGVNQTVEILLTRALKYVDSEVLYDEAKDGNPENGATDNARFMSWCVQTIHPSLKGASHKDFFNRFNAAGYVRHRGLWADISKHIQIGDIICCADNLTIDTGGKEYFIALGDDECIEAYPWENGERSSKGGKPVAKGVAKFKLSERTALGCADIAIIRVYTPKEVENDTPSTPNPPSGSVNSALAHIASFMGRTIGSGQCYALCAEFAGVLGGPGLGAGTKYSISGLSGQGSTSAAADIGICYKWSAYGWTMIQNPSLSQIVPGCILNINRSVNVTESMGEGTSAWFNWTSDPTYGHTVVVEKVSGDNLTVLEQWGGSRQYTMRNMMKYSGTGASGISSICIPPS